VVTLALGSYCESIEYNLTYLSFVSFNTPYNPVRLMYEKRTVSIEVLILRLKIQHIRCIEDTAYTLTAFFFPETAFNSFKAFLLCTS